jgi:antitoxin YefM
VPSGCRGTVTSCRYDASLRCSAQRVDHHGGYRPKFRPKIGRYLGYHRGMRILPISKMKDKLNEYVDAVAQTQDQITITKNGAPAAVLVGADEWESLQETLYWLSQPGLKESIAEAEADIAAGRTFGEDEIRAEFGVPRRTD